MITALRTSVPSFFSTYFDLPAAAEQHISGMAGSDIWGYALATAIEQGHTIIADIVDPSQWENPVDKIRVRLTGGIEHKSPCETRVWVDIEITFE